jgi:hypothetical protein
MIRIELARPIHAKAVVESFRAQEKKEFNLLSLSPIAELETQITRDESYVALVDGQPGCIWGFRDHGLSGTHLWMVTTELVGKYQKRFLKESKKVVRYGLSKHALLFGYVDLEFKTSCNWMEWLGFEPTEMTRFQDITLVKYEVRAYGP